MLKKVNNFTIGTLIYLAFSVGATASSVYSGANQTEQDKARQEALTPKPQDYTSNIISTSRQKITFPEEKDCKYIQHIRIESEDNVLTNKLLGKIIKQATNRCMGVSGIRLLGQTLQDELITRGYITSLIDIPTQSLESGILTFNLSYGKIGQIAWENSKEHNDKTSLWNVFPSSVGDILKLPDLEQGMANLQYAPGSAAHMQIFPGQHLNESDLILKRKTDKNWRISGWVDDAGSRYSGRYQGGAALYLYNLATLNDILYVAGGGDVEFNQHNDGNKNTSVYYSLPFGYWSLSLYGAYSRYLQQIRGNWSTTDYVSKNQYHSVTLSRLLSHTREQKTSLESRIFKSTSHYFFGGSELEVMRKQNPGWELTLHHQRYFGDKIVNASLGLQNRLPWLSSSATPEEKSGLYSKHARIIHADLQSRMKFSLTGDKFTWAPRINAQFSPDNLSSDNMMNIGNRWTVRGFDGERSLSSSQGGFWRNDFIWDLSTSSQQFYVGADIAKIIGKDKYQKGKVLSGAVTGLRGEILATQYELFIGTPLIKADDFHTDTINIGFLLQWRY